MADTRSAGAMTAYPAPAPAPEGPRVGWQLGDIRNLFPHNDTLARVAGLPTWNPAPAAVAAPAPAAPVAAPMTPRPDLANPNPAPAPVAAPKQQMMDPRAAILMRARNNGLNGTAIMQLAQMMKPPTVAEQFLGNVHNQALAAYNDAVQRNPQQQPQLLRRFFKTVGDARSAIGVSPLTAVQAEQLEAAMHPDAGMP